MRHLVLSLMPCLLLAACAAPSVVGPSSETSQAINPSAKVRGFELLIKAPRALGAGGAIISDAGAGALQNGSGIISDAGAGAIAPAELRFPAFRLAAASDGYWPVAKAAVRFESLEGDPVGRAELSSDQEGKVSIHHLPDVKVLTAYATFVVEGKTYEVATLVASGDAPAQLVADPVTTMIDARIQQVSRGRSYLSTLTFPGLARVQAICDKAGVEVEVEALEAEQPLSVLNAVWDREIAAKVQDPGEKAEIKAFVAAIKGEVEGP